MSKTYFASVLLVCVTAIGGCKKTDEANAGSDKPSEKGAEKASDKGSASKLQGTWTLDVDKTLALNPKMTEGTEGKPEMLAGLKGVIAGITVTIGAKDMTTGGLPGGKDEKVSYVVKTDTAKQVVLEVKGKPSTFDFSDDDHVTMVDGKTTMALVRKK